MRLVVVFSHRVWMVGVLVYPDWLAISSMGLKKRMPRAKRVKGFQPFSFQPFSLKPFSFQPFSLCCRYTCRHPCSLTCRHPCGMIWNCLLMLRVSCWLLAGSLHVCAQFTISGAVCVHSLLDTEVRLILSHSAGEFLACVVSE